MAESIPVADSWTAAWAAGWDAFPEPVAIELKADLPREDPKLVEIFSRHQAWTDSRIDQFERSLQAMIEAATEKTGAKLKAALSITNGTIDPTAANDKVLAGADRLFMDALEAEGYAKLLSGYAGGFSEQLPYLQEMLDAIGESAGRETAAVDFSPSDLKVLGRIEATTVAKLDRILAGAPAIAIDRVRFSVAGLPFEQLVGTLATQMGKTLASARTWADTAVNTWYRTAASISFEEIQADTPENAPLRFRYSGPEDLKTRPFCEHLLAAGKSYTREEIDLMNNGQLPNVFVTGGGYNCRHLFILSLK